MSALSRPPRGAANAQIFRKSPLIYVEGHDDKVFWQAFFGACCDTEVVCQEMGERDTLVKYAKYIADEDATMIVALDRDYDALRGRHVVHDRVLYTYGYSIENTMYCPDAVAECAKRYGRMGHAPKGMIRAWAVQVERQVAKLLAYDLANETLGRGLRVLGDAGQPFLRRHRSIPDADLVERKIVSVSTHFTELELADAQVRIASDGRSVLLLMRGHFLTSLVSTLVRALCKKALGRNPKTSWDSLYASLVEHCASPDYS